MAAGAVWLCDPRATSDPCRASLATTVESPTGERRVESPPAAAATAVDCFYVYPTVSDQAARNASRAKDPSVVAITAAQAARFSAICRTWAPVYRQETLASVFMGGSAQALRFAYHDVDDAWNEYLARYNGGRGFVLIGHSQGALMLRRLIREQIERRPWIRRRLVAALLPGDFALVRRGGRTGGDFRHVPTCAARAESGCVMAWNAYNERPPPSSRFGRSPRTDHSGFGLPAGPDYEVVCTDPAGPGGGAAPLVTLLRGEPFPPSLIALGLMQTWGGAPPTAPTPWLRPRDRWTGRCETHDGANVLMVAGSAGARRLNPSPNRDWGIHLMDMNIALGDLVETVRQKIETYGRAQTPALRLSAARRSCRQRRVRVLLRGRDVAVVTHVIFRTGRGGTRRDFLRPFMVTLRRPPVRSQRLRATAFLDDGRRRTLTKLLGTCRPRRQ